MVFIECRKKIVFVSFELVRFNYCFIIVLPNGHGKLDPKQFFKFYSKLRFGNLV